MTTRLVQHGHFEYVLSRKDNVIVAVWGICTLQVLFICMYIAVRIIITQVPMFGWQATLVCWIHEVVIARVYDLLTSLIESTTAAELPLFDNQTNNQWAAVGEELRTPSSGHQEGYSSVSKMYKGWERATVIQYRSRFIFFPHSGLWGNFNLLSQREISGAGSFGVVFFTSLNYLQLQLQPGPSPIPHFI